MEQIKTTETERKTTIERKNQTYTCVCCGQEYPQEKTFTFLAKGRPKRICKECADIVHGLI